MGIFKGYDGTSLAYHRLGDGPPLICLPGGPMRASSYLGDLGGLSEHHSLILMDLRGTGGSAVPADPASYRCDRQVGDVEALRGHLGLDRIDLLGHSGGTNLAVSYAVRHPDRVGRLLLITPSPRAVCLDITDADRREVAELRRGEPWFPAGFAAFERLWAGTGSDADREALQPFFYGRSDAASRAIAAREAAEKNEDAARVFGAEGAFDPPAIRAALAALHVPVLVVSGAHDVALGPRPATAYAELFHRGELTVVPAAGHYPWVDDPASFGRAVTGFLARTGAPDA